MTAVHDRPLAAAPFKSFRYPGRYCWIMIGATDTADALREAGRSLDTHGAPDIRKLEAWNGERYVQAGS